MQQQLKTRQVIALCALSFSPVFGSTIVSPIYPVMVKTLQLSSVEVGMISSVGAFTTLLGSPIIGCLSDRHGPLKMMRPLLMLYVIGTLICAASPFLGLSPFGLLLLGRSLQGFGELGGLQQGISLIASEVDEKSKGRLLSRVEASASAGGATGPLVGGVLASIAWWTGYLVPAALMTITMLFLLGSLSESSDRSFPQADKAPPEEVCVSMRLVAAALSCFSLMFGLTGMQTFVVGYIVARFGVSPAIGGLFVSLHALAMSAAAFVSGKRLSEERAPRMIGVGLAGFGVMLLFVPRISNLTTLVACMALGGAACGLILPSSNLVGTSGVQANSAARTTSLIYMLRLCGSMAGSLAFGWMMKFGYSRAFTSVGAIVLMSGAVLPIMLNGRRRNLLSA